MLKPPARLMDGPTSTSAAGGSLQVFCRHRWSCPQILAAGRPWCCPCVRVTLDDGARRPTDREVAVQAGRPQTRIGRGQVARTNIRDSGELRAISNVGADNAWTDSGRTHAGALRPSTAQTGCCVPILADATPCSRACRAQGESWSACSSKVSWRKATPRRY
jgi:hypothetical protein